MRLSLAMLLFRGRMVSFEASIYTLVPHKKEKLIHVVVHGEDFVE